MRRKHTKGADFKVGFLTKTDTTKLVLTVTFLALVFFPLLHMFSRIDLKSITSVINAPIFLTALTNSLLSASIATVITMIVAFALAMCIERTNICFRNILSIIFVIPMLIPSISSGMGLVILFGNNGLLTRLLNLKSSIYGLGGIVLGSMLYAFPVAFLMLSDVIRYEDRSPYEAAEVLGMSKFHQFKSITLPYLRKPLISVVFAIFTLIITDYGVPLMVGGKYTTLPVVMYQEVIGQLNFGKGSVYGCILLLPAVAAFVVDLINKDRGNSAFVIKPHLPSNNVWAKVASYGFCGLVTVFVLIPIVAFVLLAFTVDYPNNMAFTFDNITKAINLRGGDYLFNSIMIALMVAVVGVVIAFFTAYLAARMHSKASRFLHLSAMTSAAIPGVVLGISYVLAFKETPLYGTIIILVMVNVVHFIASPYLMIYNSLSKINENLEYVAMTMGVNRLQMIRDVFIPQCKSTILEMFSYFFVNCMVTISAVSFLATTMNKPVALMINQFEAQMQLECAAVVSLAILLVNLAVKGTIHLIKKRESNAQVKEIDHG